MVALSFVQQLFKQIHQVVQTRQVAILVIADHPRVPMVYLNTVRQRVRLGKIDHPHVGLGMVVNQQQRTADQLKEKKNLNFIFLSQGNDENQQKS